MPKIYLSPSTQEFNEYVIGNSEEYWMNLVADAMEPYLQSSGITYIRNTPQMTAASSITQSNANNVDLHVALHSNASPDNLAGQLQGTDAYYAPNSRLSKTFAEIVAKNLKTIYPTPSLVKAIPTFILGEVLRTNAPASLIEFAYHDNLEDANWIKNNINEIAENVVLSIAEYFGIPFVDAQPIRTGTVHMASGNLNIRERPNTNSDIIGTIPNGANLEVLGQTNDWYVVRYNGITGYASSEFIKV